GRLVKQELDVDEVQQNPERPGKAIVGFAILARDIRNRDFGDCRSAATGQSGNKTVQLAVELDLFDNFTSIGLEGCPEVVHPYMAHLGHQPVGDEAGKTSRQPVICSLQSPSADDVIALFHFRNKIRNLCRIVLQVAIHGNDDLAASEVKPGLQGSSLAEIPSQTDEDEAGIVLTDLDQRFVAKVLAAIVYKNHLERRSQSDHCLD